MKHVSAPSVPPLTTQAEVSAKGWGQLLQESSYVDKIRQVFRIFFRIFFLFGMFSNDSLFRKVIFIISGMLRLHTHMYLNFLS